MAARNRSLNRADQRALPLTNDEWRAHAVRMRLADEAIEVCLLWISSCIQRSRTVALNLEPGKLPHFPAIRGGLNPTERHVLYRKLAQFHRSFPVVFPFAEMAAFPEIRRDEDIRQCVRLMNDTVDRINEHLDARGTIGLDDKFLPLRPISLEPLPSSEPAEQQPAVAPGLLRALEAQVEAVRAAIVVVRNAKTPEERATAMEELAGLTSTQGELVEVLRAEQASTESQLPEWLEGARTIKMGDFWQNYEDIIAEVESGQVVILRRKVVLRRATGEASSGTTKTRLHDRPKDVYAQLADGPIALEGARVELVAYPVAGEMCRNERERLRIQAKRDADRTPDEREWLRKLRESRAKRRMG